MPNPSPILRASSGYLRSLERQSSEAIARLLRVYRASESELLQSLNRLLIQMQTLEAPTLGKLYRLQRYTELLQQVQLEMGSMGALTSHYARTVLAEARAVGSAAAIELAGLATADRDIVQAFLRMDPRGVQVAAGFTSVESPLMRMLNAQYGASWADVIATQYVNGVSLGWSPRRVVGRIMQTLQVAAPADISRIIRTAQIWAYREANMQTWRQSGVVREWIWTSALAPGRTCAACFSLHGSVHPISEALNDHFNGLCSAVPRTIDLPEYEGGGPGAIATGEETFRRMSRAEQARTAEAAGWGGLYRAWKDGAIDFSQFATQRADRIYGLMKVQNSLVALLGDRAARYYAG